MVSINGVGAGRSKHHRGTIMDHDAGSDVWLECSSVCVVDASGRIVREGKVASEWYNAKGIDSSRPITEGWAKARMRRAHGKF
jgi:hypothetical protein